MNGRTNAVAGTTLPALSNPAGAGQILSGYQAIGADGEVITGTASMLQMVSGEIRSGSKAGSVYVFNGEEVSSYYLQIGDSYNITIVKNSPVLVGFSSVTGPVTGMQRIAVGDFTLYQVTDTFSLVL